MEKLCLNCGKVMKVRPSHYSRKKYCSRECQHSHHKKNSPEAWQKMTTKKDVKCTNCGIIFKRKPSVLGQNNFCSRDCRNQYLRLNRNKINQHLKKQVTLKCVICNKDFSVIDSRKETAKYCSKECLGKANGQRSRVQYTNRIEVSCENCGKTIKKKPSTIKHWNFCSISCMGEYYAMSGSFSGTNSGTWKGGDIEYYGPNWREQRRKARKRDNYTCQDCGITEQEYGKELSVHHIIPFRHFEGNWKQANRLSNLISLCEYPCHRKRHSKHK